MSLNYDKLKAKAQQESNIWSSYSDLFMVLSLVFLLLYVTSSLRNGTEAIASFRELQTLKLEQEDLEEQVQVYNTLKKNYIDTQADNKEQEVYQNLMDKLSLLQDEAREEKESLQQQAIENAKKEEALNHYQQIVRNIINANVLAKAGIQRRDETIQEKAEVIKETRQSLAMKTEKLSQTQEDLKQKLQVIKQNESELQEQTQAIESLQARYEEKQQKLEANKKAMSQIEAEYKKTVQDLQAQKMSRAQLNQKVKELKKETRDRIKQLQQANKDVEDQLQTVDKRLTMATRDLQETQQNLQEVSAEKEELSETLRNASAKFDAETAALKQQFEEEMKAKRAAFDKQMEKEKLSAAARRKKESEFRKEAQQQKKDLEKKLNNLDSKIQDTEKQLAMAREEQDKYKAFVDDLKKQKDDLQKDLAKSQNAVNQKKKLAKSIKDALKKGGVKVDVDGRTGDVFLTFGKEYFDTGRSSLKPKMTETLQDFMPAYAKSLFQDKKISEKIESVEIIGFSSPTYNGKFIDPQTLSPGDRKAVNYNLDLSYRRARSIFQYIFDTNKMQYDYQRELLPLVKVTGRSFLAEEVRGRDKGKMLSQSEFCEKYNCKKSQKVVIKFNLKD